MDNAARRFEKQIHRLHQLLEPEGGQVTWDDHIPDPDNPTQDRQIDITIRRANTLTMVECRTHAARQDVGWIEEMIGRRQSLRADIAVAVSASGFTAGAITKARAFGIVLRDLHTLTDREIRAWGKKTKVQVHFDRFRDVTLRFYFDPIAKRDVRAEHVAAALQDDQSLLYELFALCSTKVAQRDRSQAPVLLRSLLRPLDLVISGHSVRKVRLETEYSVVIRDIDIPSVTVFDAPEVKSIDRIGAIENNDRNLFEIAQAGDEVAVVLDFSAVEVPENCHLLELSFDYGRTVTTHSFEFVGQPPFRIALESLKVQVAFDEPDLGCEATITG
jgi:hypothetical protein